MATARDLCVSALKHLGVLDSVEAGGPEVDDALTELNRFLDYLATDPASIFYRVRATTTLTPSTSPFTVGSGGTIAITRPVFFHHINYVDNSVSPAVEFPLVPYTEDEWAAEPVKDLTSTRPTRWYYNPEYPLGKLYPWPIPTASDLEWALYYSQAVSQFTDLATAVSLPPGYEEMLVKNLAVRLGPMFNTQASPFVLQAAAESLGSIRRANTRRMEMSFEAAALIDGGPGRPWDIRTGQ